MIRVLDLFSGIGGFSLGLERTGGFETVAFCEIEQFPRKVLAKHWPGVPIYEDVRELTADTLSRDGIGVDVICGGFPCQDISSAAARKRAGLDGHRSGLWAEMLRLIGEIRPRYTIVENSADLLSYDRGAFAARLFGDLAGIGFDCEWHVIPAAAVGAPHQRDRVWIVAYPNRDGEHVCAFDAEMAAAPQTLADADGIAPIGAAIARCQLPAWPDEPAIPRVAHGVPDQSHRRAALGNAVVPQIPELIGRAILAREAAA
jgi:DNA (cytosine-5)-methyltransferase 1